MTVLIAEFCQNHLGNPELLSRMIDKAAEAGATHVKIQHIYVRNLTYRPQFEEGLVQDGRRRSIKRPWRPEYERLQTLELDADAVKHFVSYANSKGVIPMTTCFARRDISAIYEQGFRSVKVASYDCPSYQMLRELAVKFDHLFISTGACFDDEIRTATNVIGDRVPFTLLHCVTKYPTALEDMHLRRMEWLRQFSDSVGLSDHSLVSRDGLIASKAAITLGADVVERHFTILSEDQSKDGPVSITPQLLKELKSFSQLDRAAQKSELDKACPDWARRLAGDQQRTLTDEELLNRDYYRGRFASPRFPDSPDASTMIFNWEETPL